MKIPHSEEKIENLANIAEHYGILVALQEAIEYGYSQCIEAAKGCVPEERERYFSCGVTACQTGQPTFCEHIGEWIGFNDCRAETLKNLESLSLDSTKE